MGDSPAGRPAELSPAGRPAQLSPATRVQIFYSIHALQTTLAEQNRKRMDEHVEKLAKEHRITKSVVEETFQEAAAFFGTVEEWQYATTNPSGRAQSFKSGIPVSRDKERFKQQPSKRFKPEIVGEIRHLGRQGKGIAAIIEHMQKNRDIEVTAEKVGDIIDGKTYSKVGWDYMPSDTDANTPIQASHRSIHERSSVAEEGTSSDAVRCASQPAPPSG